MVSNVKRSKTQFRCSSVNSACMALSLIMATGQKKANMVSIVPRDWKRTGDHVI
jgi:hypothetical protein